MQQQRPTTAKNKFYFFKRKGFGESLYQKHNCRNAQEKRKSENLLGGTLLIFFFFNHPGVQGENFPEVLPSTPPAPCLPSRFPPCPTRPFHCTHIPRPHIYSSIFPEPSAKVPHAHPVSRPVRQGRWLQPFYKGGTRA